MTRPKRAATMPPDQQRIRAVRVIDVSLIGQTIRQWRRFPRRTRQARNLVRTCPSPRRTRDATALVAKSRYVDKSFWLFLAHRRTIKKEDIAAFHRLRSCPVASCRYVDVTWTMSFSDR